MDASNADFSGRLGRGNRAYRVSNRRRLDGSFAGDDDDKYGDFSDDEDETFDRRLARLKREVEEMKVEFEAAQTKAGAAAENQNQNLNQGEEGSTADMAKLSEALDSIYTAQHGGSKNAQAELVALLDSKEKSNGTPATKDDVSKAHPDIDPQMAQAFLKTAEFESRLTFLEAALGLTGSNSPDQGSFAARPIIPSLDVIDRQIQIISNAPSSVDSALSKIRQLTKDAERLKRLREAGEEESANSPALTNGHTFDESPAQSSKINALYGTLSTIDSLSPTLPMVLERLRTLRALHTSAAAAGAALDDVEKRQAEQATEIEHWKEALQKAESHVKNGQSSLKENVGEVEQWVKDLESRLARIV